MTIKDDDREKLRAAKRTVVQTRKEMEELAAQIRASRETIATSERLLERLEVLLRDLDGNKP